MPPFVYRSLKDYMRTATMGSARQELLRKLLAQAAQRKTQLHIDASGARMSTFPEMFGQSLAKNMDKQAFLGAGLNMAGRGIANFARNQLQGGLGKAVGNMGNAVRGMGIQAQRAGQRIGTAAQPLVNELKDMGGQVMNRGAQTMNKLPSWALPAAGGAVVGGAAATDIHNARDMRQSRLPQTMPQMPGGVFNSPQFEKLPYKMPRPNGIIPGGMNMPQYQKHRADGVDMPNHARQQGGLMMGNDPYSMNLAKAGAFKHSGLANIGTHLMRDLPRMAERGLNRYGDLLSGHTAKEMFPLAAVANTLKNGPQMQQHIMSNGDSVLEVVNQQTLKRILDAYKNEVGKVVLTRGGTAGAGALGVAGLASALGEKKSAQMTNKQANMALIRQMISPALKRLQGYGADAMAGATRAGSRYLDLMNAKTLKNIVNQYGLATDMRSAVSPYSAEALKAMQAAGGSGLSGELATHIDDMARGLQHKGLGEAAKVIGTRTGTVGAGLLGGSALINGMQNEKTSGLMDEVLRRAASGVKGVVTGHGGQLLEAMTPKAQGFKRYLEMLRFQRVNALRDNAEKLIKLHPNASDEFVEQMSEAYLPELYKSVGTGAGTATGGVLGLNALFSGNQQQPVMKQSAANTGSPMSFALPAAAVGAIGGGLTGAVMGPRKKKLRAILKGLVSGGLTGAGAGVGLSVGGELGGRAGYAIPGGSFFDKLQRGNIGAHAGAPLGAVGGGALGALLASRLNAMTDATIDGDEEKYSAEMPQPSSRGTTKKVTMPEASEQEPDCDPEGADMTEKDHDVKKALADEFNTFMNKLVRSPSGMNIHFDRLGVGGAAAGALAGALSAPRGKLLRRALQGAGVGAAVGLGSGAGASLGANIAGGPSRLKYEIDRHTGANNFTKRLTTGATIGAGAGAGTTGLLAAKILNEPAKSDKKDKNDKDDNDDEVKKAAAALWHVLKKNNPEQFKAAAGPGSVEFGMQVTPMGSRQAGPIVTQPKPIRMPVGPAPAAAPLPGAVATAPGRRATGLDEMPTVPSRHAPVRVSRGTPTPPPGAVATAPGRRATALDMPANAPNSTGLPGIGTQNQTSDGIVLSDSPLAGRQISR